MFKSIKASDLFSWKELDYEIKSGISQITGFNFDDNTSEGSGKSSIPNVLCWVLYGKIPKEVKIDEVVRDGAGTGIGIVELENGYSIIRSRKPNILKIVSDEGQEILGKDAKETQLLINKLVGLDFDSFCQSVYFAQNYPNKFISSNEASKAQILSEIQDLSVFDRARKKVQDLLKTKQSEFLDVSREQERISYGIDSLNSNSKLLKAFIEKFESEKEENLQTIKNQVAKTEKLISYLEDEIKKIEVPADEELKQVSQMLKEATETKIITSNKIKNLDSKKRERERLEAESSRIHKTLDNLVTKIAKFENSDHKCPTCGEPVKEHKISEIFKEKRVLEKEIEETVKHRDFVISELSGLKVESSSELKAFLAEITEELVKLEELETKLNASAWLNQRKHIDLTNAQKTLIELRNDYSKAESKKIIKEISDLEKIESEMLKLKKQKSSVSEKAETLNAQVLRLEVLKEGFKEIKSYVFQSILQELSYKSTNLASELFEVPVSIRFFNEEQDGSMSKILTEVTLNGITRGLGLLSGGQYRRIELAVDLALASIVGKRSSNPINFRILDEPLKDLSDSSVEKVIELLKKLEGSTILIEHNGLAKSIVHSTFDVHYKNGISSHGN